MLAVQHAQRRGAGDLVEVLGLDQRDLALIDRGPVAGAFEVAVAAQPFAFDGFDLIDRLHRLAALPRYEKLLNDSAHGEMILGFYRLGKIVRGVGSVGSAVALSSRSFFAFTHIGGFVS